MLNSDILQHVETAVEQLQMPQSPANLYDPIRYILSLGGKRIRPYCLLLGNSLFGGKMEDATSAAMAIEVFHNFTLLHDDIMDNAPLRRGKPTVHIKWNQTIGILSGDAMFVQAVELLTSVPAQAMKPCFDVFNKTALKVCEGQQLDMDFESETSISEEDYIEMIRLKTAVLVGASFQMGGIIGGASAADQAELYDFGINLGLAFQLKDDYLDTFSSDGSSFGKQVGGDIKSNKKTFLVIKALEKANDAQKAELNRWMNTPENEPNKVDSVKTLFNELGIGELTQNKVEQYTNKAFQNIQALSIAEKDKEPLTELADFLLNRII